MLEIYKENKIYKETVKFRKRHKQKQESVDEF